MRLLAAAPLALVVSAPVASGEIASLQIKIIQGEDTVHSAGRRGRRPIRVEVQEPTGKPVEGAVVSFSLPEEHGSQFANGMKTEIVTTGADGRASVWGMEWGKEPGPVRIRITASKGEARAGGILVQTLAEEAPAVEAAAERPVKIAKPGSRWTLIAVVAAGAAAGALSAGLTKKGAAAAGPAAAAPALQIGPPAISVTRP
ncbi:MAG: hypothetical protein FJW20_13810 [Acidimicrobiia bacterium]|nr:hypothetical protein [Acidimicrobiia bacterium]